MLRIHLILMLIRIQFISLSFTELFLTENNFQFFFIFVRIFFLLKLDEPFRHEEIFKISISDSDLGLRSKKDFFLQFLFDILPLGSGSVDPIFGDPDPGSQNFPDPDHKH